MTRKGVGERIVLLRRRIATIEAREPAGHCPAGALARTSPRQLSEQDPFERLLRNLGSVSLCEIIPAHPRAAGAAAGFICALALRAAAARPGAGVVWIAEDMAAREIGLLYGKGLEARGFDPARLVFVKTRSPRETLWAMEEALKSRAVAIVAESWIAPRAYDLTASRRLLLTARRGGGLGLLLLPRASGEAARLTTAAPLRFEVAASPPPAAAEWGEPIAATGQGAPLPGPMGWRLRIVRARAGLLGSGEIDPLAWRVLTWRDIVFGSDKAVFQHAFPERLPAFAVDRPDFAWARSEHR
jgi:protein ImuA